jgi:hypothetical protein
MKDFTERIKAILVSLGGDGLIFGIENVVWKQVTAHEIPGEAITGVWLDVSLADPYGKHSGASKNYVSSCGFNWNEDRLDDAKLTDLVRSRVADALKKLQDCVRADKSVGLFEPQPDPVAET